MKKNYFITLLLTLCFSALSFGQTAVITGYMDSTCSSQAGRTLEIYVDGTIDFTGWSVVRQSNGGGFSPGSTTIDISALGSVTDAFVYLTNSATTIDTEFSITVNVLENSNINGNGDDGWQILNSSSAVIDRLGVDNEDATGTAWDHVDSYLYRKDGATPNAGAFDVNNWTFGGTNLLDGQCGSLSTHVPFGSYMATASTDPEITVTGSTTSFDYFEGFGPSAEQTVTISGANLTADIDIAAPTNFEVSLSSGTGFASSAIIPQAGGTAAATTLYIRLADGLSANTYMGDITASSAGAPNNTGSLTGIVSPAVPQFTVTAFLNDMNYVISVGGPSAEDDFTVEGLFLTNDIVVTAPTNYEVSLTSGGTFTSSVNITPSSGTVAQTMVYVRLADGLTAGNYTGNITVSSTGVTPDELIAVNGNAYGAPTNSMVITGVYDGPLSGGTPKGVELFVLTEIPTGDLSLYGISSVSNGGGSTAGNVEFPLPTNGAPIPAGTFIYVSNETTNFATFFGISTDYNTGVVNINGDDSIELYESGQIIDVFGDVDNDGTGEAWEYLDGWAYRNSNTGPEGTTFTPGNWSYSGVDGLEGETLNSTAATPFPIGTYQNTVASVGDNTIEGFAAYPNPVNNKRFTITTNSISEKEVRIFNVLGRQVYTTSFSSNNKLVDISNLTSGVYILKVLEGSKSATKKLVVR
ncbi:MAG: T9SS type A sorting domain-containing protein [Flavobacteriaceae bacterium]